MHHRTCRLLLPLTAAAVTLLPAGQAIAQRDLGPGLSGPENGVLCDEAGPVCYDSQGPSIGHTQTYFGRIAADRLSRELSGRPPARDFRLSSGAVCDTGSRNCWSDGWQKQVAAPRLSQQLFGSSQASGAGSLGSLQGPEPGVLCDPAAQRCYDRLGLSLGITRNYYGAYAEQRALRSLAGQAPPRAFSLSNGSVCDVDAKRCWSDGWDRRQPDPGVSRQLFGSEAAGTARLAQCRLSRWFQVLASGRCEINETRNPQGRSLEVTLKDGSVYAFSKPRGESYRLTDRKGVTWPVRVTDNGNSLSLSWSDRVLQVTPQRPPGAGAPSLGQLIDALLGN